MEIVGHLPTQRSRNASDQLEHQPSCQHDFGPALRASRSMSTKTHGLRARRNVLSFNERSTSITLIWQIQPQAEGSSCLRAPGTSPRSASTSLFSDPKPATARLKFKHAPFYGRISFAIKDPSPRVTSLLRYKSPASVCRSVFLIEYSAILAWIRLVSPQASSLSYSSLALSSIT